jgi:hypothetical protein
MLIFEDYSFIVVPRNFGTRCCDAAHKKFKRAMCSLTDSYDLYEFTWYCHVMQMIREHILCTSVSSREAFDEMPRKSNTGQTAYIEGDRK